MVARHQDAVKRGGRSDAESIRRTDSQTEAIPDATI